MASPVVVLRTGRDEMESLLGCIRRKGWPLKWLVKQYYECTLVRTSALGVSHLLYLFMCLSPLNSRPEKAIKTAVEFA